MSDYKIGSIVPLTEDSKETRLVYALKNLNSTIAERDALRAELAAAKEEAARFERHYIGTTKDIEKMRDQLAEATEERASLTAHVQRLEKALKEIADDGVERSRDPRTLTAQAALAATPAQSLAAHDAALLREVAKQMDPDGGCYEALMAEADRIEQEVRRG